MSISLILLGLLDIICGISFIFNFFEKIFGFILILKAIFFLMLSPTFFLNWLDLISGIIMIVPSVPSIIKVGVSLYLIGKGSLSFIPR